MRFTPEEIAAVTGGSICNGVQGQSTCTSFTWDSRHVEAGTLYIAISGQRVDGHTFCLSAAQAGAVACLVEHRLPEAEEAQIAQAGAALVLVPNVQAAFTQLAAAWREKLQGTVIAVTGSSGKTTTKNLVRDVLSAHGSTVATQGNQNNELGVPATVLRADVDTKFVVVEMGMRGLGELQELCTFVKPHWALVTNVGESHIELLGSRDGIAHAKAEALFAVPEGGLAFVNSSDDYAVQLAEYGQVNEHGATLVHFDGSGCAPEERPESLRPSVWASDIQVADNGCASFVLHTPAGSAPCSLAMPGVHNVHNACAAAACGVSAGMDPALITRVLGEARAQTGRQNVITAPSGVIVIDDAYNANPDSMRASLASFAAMRTQGSRVAVLGDMGELGSFAEDGHRRVGKLAAQAGLDRLICVGPLARIIAQSAAEEGLAESAISCVDDAASALAQLEGSLHEGDAVLVKASHSVGLEVVVEGLVS